MKPGKELLFLALGGSGEIGMNVNLYGCEGKWVMVDLGLTFADPYYPGVELVLPDLAFIEERNATICSASSSPTAMRIISARSPISPTISACRSTRRRSPPA